MRLCPTKKKGVICKRVKYFWPPSVFPWYWAVVQPPKMLAVSFYRHLTGQSTLCSTAPIPAAVLNSSFYRRTTQAARWWIQQRGGAKLSRAYSQRYSSKVDRVWEAQQSWLMAWSARLAPHDPITSTLTMRIPKVRTRGKARRKRKVNSKDNAALT